MKKIYLFSLEGIVYAIKEDGQNESSSAMYGFTQRPTDIQEKYLIEKFQELTEKFKIEYIVINVSSEVDKEELAFAIKKLIDYEKINRPDSGDVEYWERALVRIKYSSFDIYNKNILQKIISKSPV